MRVKCRNFNNNVICHINNQNRASDSSDTNVMSGTHEEFRATYGCPFTMVKAWEVLKNSPKWYLVPPIKLGHSSNRSKTTSGTPEPRSSASGSDARLYLDLNDFNYELDFESLSNHKNCNAHKVEIKTRQLDEKLTRILSLKEQKIQLQMNS
ncbi:hypothetical protein Hanom_Chr00s000002g01600471 [Helianthus anomalus]